MRGIRLTTYKPRHRAEGRASTARPLLPHRPRRCAGTACAHRHDTRPVTR